ncbi:MAG TPA: S8 family serine peptidase [Methanospirillum sp.]|nr:S8 family serine peptidase [Methanospirillum sp.]
MAAKNRREKHGLQTGIIGCTILFFLIVWILSPVEGVGSRITVGDALLKTDQLRDQTRSGGANIPVGVISNGVLGLEDAQQSGDLPSEVTVLKEGKESEGTAILEIIHDIAPDAPLIFADFGGGKEQNFVTAIQNLIASGARVIVDDVGFLQTSYFEDGTIASSLNQLLEAHPDIILVSAAGNNADAHYQGLFEDDGTGYHSCNGKTGIPVVINPGANISVFLQWDDPFTSSNNDYNLYLVENGEIIRTSERPQRGGESPFEKFTYQNKGKESVNAEIRISQAGENTEPAILEVFINAPKNKVKVPPEFLIPEDSIIGQAAVPKVISVAAISSEKVPDIAKFSSNGYVTISWPEPEKRMKPDVVGISNVEVSGSGRFPTVFRGTSAAAPHIGGLIALEWSLFPNLPADEIRKALLNSSLELGTPGWDSAFGYGLPDALKMYEQLKAVSPESSSGSGATPVVQVPSNLIGSEIIQPGVIIGPIIITEPGVYTLGADIFDYSGMIISIFTSDVTIVGAGHTIEGTSVQFVDEEPVMQTGILIQSPDNSRISNVLVQDLTVTGTNTGIGGTGVEGLVINNCQLGFNTNGIVISDSHDVVISGNKISGNADVGIIVTGTDNTTIDGNIIDNNLYGIMTGGSSNNHLINNEIRDNLRDSEMAQTEEESELISAPGSPGNTTCPEGYSEDTSGGCILITGPVEAGSPGTSGPNMTESNPSESGSSGEPDSFENESIESTPNEGFESCNSDEIWDSTTKTCVNVNCDFSELRSLLKLDFGGDFQDLTDSSNKAEILKYRSNSPKNERGEYDECLIEVTRYPTISDAMVYVQNRGHCINKLVGNRYVVSVCVPHYYGNLGIHEQEVLSDLSSKLEKYLLNTGLSCDPPLNEEESYSIPELSDPSVQISGNQLDDSTGNAAETIKENETDAICSCPGFTDDIIVKGTSFTRNPDDCLYHGTGSDGHHLVFDCHTMWFTCLTCGNNGAVSMSEIS